MAYICDNCGKGVVIGRSQRHRRGVAGKRWLKRAPKTARTFKPNLQKISVLVNGKKVQMRLCTKCIKKLKKEKKLHSLVNVTLG
ncbi:hypothetical protein A2361_01705 [Candidatus Woesebacteria bacterium RIFOXYB1_FULL_40_26]|uniref:Large ribosomal subunit protein bL28 n=2 Tax=Candidatus Woeseibacteriota TaxID=1752722 RepID=A0A1F8DFL4_9BACT|nr:MAG: hypothetical protein A2361_01705 [Candidatus Woesebacteria bacterium RIFOXYB1_FULL_40_26]OGM87166.1 MAG: hypothetical protein A2614_01825 [Candidatus Woesebacteria bacterium RIFOXYD1_FULL_40_21]